MSDRQNIQNAIQRFANYLAAGGLNNNDNDNNNNNDNDNNNDNNNNNINENEAIINGEGAAEELRNRDLHANHNVEDEDDEDEAEAADDGSVNNHRNGGIIEGGVAGRPSKKDPLLGEGNDTDAKKKSSECDLFLLIECVEKLQNTPDAICNTVGNIVSIGLHDKTTKMATVFRHFCKFCSLPNDPLQYVDVEFVHNDVVPHNETAEGCSIMKGDKIKVRLVRTKERMEREIRLNAQRESDKEYLKQLRVLFLESVNSLHMAFPVTFGGPNVVIECRPFLEVGQRGVLNHVIKAHESIISKRCPWLKDKIAKAKEETQRQRPSLDQQEDQRFFQGLVRIPDLHDSSSNGLPDTASPAAPPHPLENGRNIQRQYNGDDDDEDSVVHYDPESQGGRQLNQDRGVAHQIDDEESAHYSNDQRSPVVVHDSMVLLSLKEHPPEAVKILLEYCYTNRVVGLGKEAFVQASINSVPPHSWPSQGLPSVSMAVTLAGIALAEEANMPRLSLMCEIAASCLLSDSNVLDALARCSEQESKTGNCLPILRKKAITYLIHAPLLRTQNKKMITKLADMKDLLVPVLLQGTLDVVLSSPYAKRKRPSSGHHDPFYLVVDTEDKEARKRERLQSRTEGKVSGQQNNTSWKCLV